MSAMPKMDTFATTFDELRRVLRPYARRAIVQTDTPTEYILCVRGMTDRAGRPLYFAAVRLGKAYVSYHLMPLYGSADLVKAISPSLKKRMQGKTCFNFTTVERDHLKELAALTRTGFTSFKRVKLPWA
jgi:hypothetical protein